MRTIRKLEGFTTRDLRAAHEEGLPLTSEHAGRRWSRFIDHDLRLQIQLCREQFGLCCYSEVNLSDFFIQEELHSHIEHVEPKKIAPSKTFDYHNLMLSALSSHDLQGFTDSSHFAGHHKGSDYDAGNFVHPLSPDCRNYFIFSTQSGEISPNLSLTQTEQDKAQYTIKLLNLNAPYLKAERRKWLQELDSALESCGDDISAIENLAEAELTLTERRCPFNGFRMDQLRKFHSASRSLFGNLGEQVIQRLCPEIN